jgi:hypothetical protein
MKEKEKSGEIRELQDVQKDMLVYKTAEELFGNIQETDDIIKYIDTHFDEVYFLEVHATDVIKYKDVPVLYDKMCQYIQHAEYHPLHIMIFKINQTTKDVAKNVYQEMKKKYGDMVQLDTSNYRCIV